MRENFFDDNRDLQFHFQNLGLEEVVGLREGGFAEPGPGSPRNVEEACKAYLEKLELVGELSGERIAPRAAEVDRAGAVCVDHEVTLPDEILANLKELRDAKLTGVTLPREYGGLNFPTTIYSMMTEMVSRADASLQNLFGLQSIAETVHLFGSPEQKAAVLPKLASGEWDGAMALTEPEAGSDLQSVQTRATLGEDGVWRLNGLKHFITNGIAKVLLVLARSEEGSRDGRGLSLFLAHPCPEIVVNRIERKMGIHGSPTCELQFNDAPVELVGRRRFGLVRYVMSMMNGARLAISAQAVGLSEACRKAAWAYCVERRQFGRSLAELKPVWEMLSRMDALTEASRELLYETCRYVDLRDAWNRYAEAHPEDREAAARGRNYGVLADVLTPMTKAFSTESANQCAYDCIQCHGGKGYMTERPVERYYRDARIMNIYEGTTQMQVVAATAGILKQSHNGVLAELEKCAFSEEASALLEKVKPVRARLEEARERLTGSEELELYARRLVRGLTIVLAAYLLLRDASRDAGRMENARRFLWEFLPEAEMHASVLLDSLA